MWTVERNHALAEKMASQMRLRAGDFETLVARAGRRLPRRLRRDARFLIETEKLARHPKLARRVDLGRVKRAERHIDEWLDTLDPAAERRAAILDHLAAIAFVVAVVTLALFGWMLWQGRLG